MLLIFTRLININRLLPVCWSTGNTLCFQQGSLDYKKGEVSELKALLRNRQIERDPKKRREVIKKVIGYQTLGIDVSKLFSDMIMAVATSDLVVKKMVYLYLTTHAEQKPELALLAINTLQKDCRDDDPSTLMRNTAHFFHHSIAHDLFLCIHTLTHPRPHLQIVHTGSLNILISLLCSFLTLFLPTFFARFCAVVRGMALRSLCSLRCDFSAIQPRFSSMLHAHSHIFNQRLSVYSIHLFLP